MKSEGAPDDARAAAEESSPGAPAAREVLVARGLHGVGTKRSSSAKAAMERSFAQLTPDENEDENEDEDDKGPVLDVLLSLARAVDGFPLVLLSAAVVLDPCASSALTRDEEEEEEEEEEDEDRSMDREEGGG